MLLYLSKAQILCKSHGANQDSVHLLQINNDVTKSYEVAAAEGLLSEERVK